MKNPEGNFAIYLQQFFWLCGKIAVLLQADYYQECVRI